MRPTAAQIFRIHPERRRLAARILAALVVVVGDAVLGANLFGEGARILRMHDNAPAMSWNTALCLVLLGMSLILLPAAGSKRRRIRTRILPGAVAILCVLDVTVGLLPPGSGLAAAVAPVSDMATGMSTLAVVDVWFAALAILCLTSRSRRLARVVRALAVTGLLIAYTAVLAHAFDPGALALNLAYEGMSLTASLCFVMLFSSICLIDPRPTWLDAISGFGNGARTARRLAPLVVLGPLVLAIVAMKSTQAGLLSPDLRLVLLIASLTFVAAETLSRTAQAENLAQETLVARNRLLEQVVDALPISVIALDQHGREVHSNEAARALGAGFDDPAAWLLGAEFARPGSDAPLAEEDRPVARVLRGEILDLEPYVARRSNGRRVAVRIGSSDRIYPYDAPYVVTVIEDGPVVRTPSPLT